MLSGTASRMSISIKIIGGSFFTYLDLPKRVRLRTKFGVLDIYGGAPLSLSLHHLLLQMFKTEHAIDLAFTSA